MFQKCQFTLRVQPHHNSAPMHHNWAPSSFMADMTAALSSFYPFAASLPAARRFPSPRLSLNPAATTFSLVFKLAERRVMSWSIGSSPTLATVSSYGCMMPHTTGDCFQSRYTADSTFLQRRPYSSLSVPFPIINVCRTTRGLTKPATAQRRLSSLSVNSRQVPASVDVSAVTEPQQDDNRANVLPALPTLQFHNSMTHQKEELQPIREGHVGMYVCGITSYDYCHIGHARVYTTFDVLYR